MTCLVQIITCLRKVGAQIITCLRRFGDQTITCLRKVGAQTFTCLWKVGAQTFTCLRKVGAQTLTCLRKFGEKPTPARISSSSSLIEGSDTWSTSFWRLLHTWQQKNRFTMSGQHNLAHLTAEEQIYHVRSTQYWLAHLTQKNRFTMSGQDNLAHLTAEEQIYHVRSRQPCTPDSRRTDLPCQVKTTLHTWHRRTDLPCQVKTTLHTWQQENRFTMSGQDNLVFIHMF